MKQNIDDFEQDEEMSGKDKLRKWIYLAVVGVCLIAAVIIIVCVVRHSNNLREKENVYNSLQSQIEVVDPTKSETDSDKTSSGEETASEATEESSEELPDPDENMNRVVDFDTLQANTNKDIYAWIYIPDTRVDYPVLQHPTDDTYYLKYNIDGSKGYPGCIYSEMENDKDFTDFNTVLYGHNMKNGTMFRDLHKYKEDNYLEEHPYVYIYLPDKTLKYEVFAAYQFDDRHLLYAFDYSSEASRKEYLDSIFDVKSQYKDFNKEVELDGNSHIITLSTCVGGQSTKRYLVQAVLVNEDALE